MNFHRKSNFLFTSYFPLKSKNSKSRKKLKNKKKERYKINNDWYVWSTGKCCMTLWWKIDFSFFMDLSIFVLFGKNLTPNMPQELENKNIYKLVPYSLSITLFIGLNRVDSLQDQLGLVWQFHINYFSKLKKIKI